MAAPFRLASHEVHTWCARLDVPPEAAARFFATLTADERDRSTRFRFERDRQHFIVAHGVLRDLLGRYLQTEPAGITFVYTAFGKPDLDVELGGRLEFSLSHSAGLAMIAIAAESSVGVDLEHIRSELDYAELASRFFSATEVDQLRDVPSHLYAEAFLRCWTKKEACLKACGAGLAIPLNSFAVPLTTDPTQGAAEVHLPANDVAGATCWSVYTLEPAAGYVGALAVEGSGWRLSHRQWKVRES